MASVVISGDTSGAITISAPAVAGTPTLTLPTTTDTLVGKATTDTLTNKTLTSPTIATPTMTGQATIPTINLTGGQIAFPATQSASTDANTLDDYEEGTWTPTVYGSGGSAGSQAYSSQFGLYIKIGKLVQLTGFAGLSNKGSWTGQVIIGGLPFTSANNNGAYGGTSFYNSNMSYPAGGSGGGAYPVPNTATAFVFYNSGTGGVSNADYSYLTNTSQLGAFTIMYYAAA